MKKSIVLICFTCLAGNLYCQQESAEKARQLFPDANAVILSGTDDYHIYIEDGRLQAVCNVSHQVFINKEAGLMFQKKTIPTNSFTPVSDISAYTLVPKGSKYEKKKVEKIDLKDDPDESSFYDEEKSYRFIYPSVQTGAILEENYKITYADPHFVGSFFFTGYLPMLENDLMITVQKDIHINFKIFNGENRNIEFTKEEKKNEIVYHWKTANTKAIKDDDGAPNFRYYEPHIVFYITDYKIGDQKQHLLGSPKDLYAWYYELQKNVNKREDEKLKAVADSLVEGVTDELEKVKKIFYWVQDNISYVAFEDGLGGFIPRDACTVYSKKYGDCKDMASIIHEMLRMAGIKSYLTWIGSRDIPYSYNDVPTPSADNHMITSYLDKNNQWHFLDGTGKKAPEDLYTSFIQGKQALIGISRDSFVLVTVPVKDTSVSQTIDSVTFEIKDNKITGNGSIILTGYDALHYTYHSETLNKDEWTDFFKDYFPKGSNKVTYSQVVTNSPQRARLDISYKFDLPDYIRKDQDELYVNLNINKGTGLETLNDSRKTPLGFTNKTMKRDIMILKIPQGYKVEYLPESVKYGNDIAGFSNNYSVKDGEIILCTDFYIDTLLLEEKDFEKYNNVLREQVKANKQTVSLIKN
jgi:hypothetical protein